MTSSIVVGSGPAGLTAAHLLNLQGKPVRLVEPAAEPGGLWAGTETKGRYFERGMHNYVECGIPEIDDFYFGLPVQQHVLEGKDRDRAGIFYKQLQTYSPAIDLRGSWRQPVAGAQIMKLLADEAWEHGSTAIELAASKWGTTIAESVIMPVLRKIYGTARLKPRALDLTNLHRVILFGEKAMHEIMASDWLRARLAWPDQDTLPEKYSSGRRAFYPVEGMRGLVNGALGSLRQRGVDVAIGVDVLMPQPQPIYWAAGLPKLAKALGINFPKVTTRPLTVVNFTGTLKTQGLHYFHVYDSEFKTFRVTCYQNFSFFQQTTVELLDDLPTTEGSALAIRELEQMGFNTSTLGLVSAHTIPGALIVPNQVNDDLLEHFRRRVAELAPNVVLLGSHARNGLFFQPDVLRHVWNTINCYQQGG